MRTLLVGVLLIAHFTAASAQVNRVATDTVFVRGNSAPVWGTNVALTSVFRIGQVNGPSEYAFGEITSFAVDRRGRFYMYDRDDSQVRAYDANGKFLRDIGRGGLGPGEYRSVWELDIAGDTVLSVFDIHGRLTLFEPGGTVRRIIENSRISTGGDHYYGSDIAGMHYVRMSVFGPGFPENSEVPNPGADVQDQFLILNSQGLRVDSTMMPKFPQPTPKRFGISTSEGGASNFVSEGLAAPSPAGGIVYGYGGSYRFAIKPLRGPTIIVERPWTPIPVAGAERANWQEFVEFYARRGSGTYTIPAAKPAYHDLFADSDGRVWVSVYTAAERRDIPPRPPGNPAPVLLWHQRLTFDVFDKAGAYLGRIALKPNAQMLDAQGDRVFVLERGIDDVESVVCYRIGGAAR